MITIGFVQIAELSWQHRQREQYRLVDGILVPKHHDNVAKNTEFVYLPLSVGYLQAYLRRHAVDPGRYQFLPPIFKRIPVADAVDALAGADIVGFSAYVWNINLSLRIARELKQRHPEALIVFGGPQVPDDAESLLRANPQVDVAVHGEGEQAFLALAESHGRADRRQVPSISYLGAGGEFVRTDRAPRMRDLAEVPSPYLEGVFDSLVETNPGLRWLVMWETNRGCPFSCSFCDWGSAVGAKVSRFEMERIVSEIDWFVSRRISHLFICDANFGIMPRDLDIAGLLVERYEAAAIAVAVSVQNSKNASERTFQIQQIFSNSKLVHFGATLSMQSVSNSALSAIKRKNISLEAFHDLHRRFRDVGVETYTDLIVGLPGETYHSFAEGVDEVIDRGQHNRIAFYNCSVLPNAEMGSKSYQDLHGISFVPVPIVHEHESLDRLDRSEAIEFLDTVISTATMNRDDWVRTRVFAWAVDSLHFNRVLNVAAIAMRAVFGVRYRTFYETILAASADAYPVCAEIRDVLTEQAKRLQAGAPEYVPSEKWLNVWWPADQFVLIKLVCEHKIDAFYDEVECLLQELVAPFAQPEDGAIVRDAVALSRALLRRPKEFEDLELRLSCNMREFVAGVVAGSPVVLRLEPSCYRIDRTSTVWVTQKAWCEDVLVQYYRRSDFAYPIMAYVTDAPVATGAMMREARMPERSAVP